MTLADDGAAGRTAGLALVVAVAENGVIGRGGDLPWHLPADLRHFKRLTRDHTVVMGRRTYGSIGRPLPRRRNIVLSRDPDYRPAGVDVATSLGTALGMTAPEDQIFVIGGAGVFAEALPMASVLHWTRVHAEVEGDVEFPPVDWGAWHLDWEERHDADGRHPYPYTFQRFLRHHG